MRKLAFGTMVALAVVSIAASVVVAHEAGRYKKDGKACVWDAKDTGPNQCTPQVEGYFKKSGDTCTWTVNAKGTDQCRPAKGRFKKDGDACLWNGTDSGPDQCDPRAIK